LGAYRASLEEQQLTIESVSPLQQGETEIVAGAFGLTPDLYTTITLNKKRMSGKLVPINEELRKSLICTLTDDFRIYSLGRYAIWKAIRSDEVVKDIEAIRAMMRSRYSTISSRI
jgi:hypothetical protein